MPISTLTLRHELVLSFYHQIENERTHSYINTDTSHDWDQPNTPDPHHTNASDSETHPY